MDVTSCPCCSMRDYSGCCGPFLEGRERAPDPEALMRSRYTAFCRGDADYLLATLDPDKRSAPGDLVRLRQELARTIASTQWLGLKVMASASRGPERGMVEFAAFYQAKNREGQDHGQPCDPLFDQLHERSVFVLKQGAWYYRDGEILPDIAMGRNTPCFCGSAKKFKRCHGKAQ